MKTILFSILTVLLIITSAQAQEGNKNNPNDTNYYQMKELPADPAAISSPAKALEGPNPQNQAACCTNYYSTAPLVSVEPKYDGLLEGLNPSPTKPTDSTGAPATH